MEKLAKEARLLDNYYNRYHEAVISSICSGDQREVKKKIDMGFVKPPEVEAIKEVLGKDKRSEKGKSYGYSKERFLEIGLCMHVLTYVAQFYTRKTTSRCGKLAKQALEGNPNAIDDLRRNLSYCRWNY